jgi:hypothetical protein
VAAAVVLAIAILAGAVLGRGSLEETVEVVVGADLLEEEDLVIRGVRHRGVQVFRGIANFFSSYHLKKFTEFLGIIFPRKGERS